MRAAGQETGPAEQTTVGSRVSAQSKQGAVRRMVGAHMLGRLLLFRWVARGQKRGKTRGAELLVHKGALGGGWGDQRLSPLRSLVAASAAQPNNKGAPDAVSSAMHG